MITAAEARAATVNAQEQKMTESARKDLKSRSNLRSHSVYVEARTSKLSETEAEELTLRIQRAANFGNGLLHTVRVPGRPPTLELAARAFGLAERDAEFLRGFGFKVEVGLPYTNHDHGGRHSYSCGVDVSW